MAKQKVNEYYQWQLRRLFLRELESCQPKIISDLKTTILAAYQNGFAEKPEKVSYEELRDAISKPGNYPVKLNDFAQIYISWIKVSKLYADWLADAFLHLLFNWSQKPHWLEKGHLRDSVGVSFFTSFGKEFKFTFRSIIKDETPNYYAKSLDAAYKKQKQLYLAEMKSKFTVLPISKK